MAKRAGNRSFLGRMLIDNWKNKGVALFLALVVWAFAFGSTQEEQSFTALIRVKKDDSIAIEAASVVQGDEIQPGADFVFQGMRGRGPVTQVNIVLSGQRRIVQNLQSLIGVLQINEEISEYNLKDPSIYMGLPQGVLIKKVDPAVIRVDTEEVVSKPKPIEVATPAVKGQPAPRLARTPEITIVPQSLELVGPESLVARARLELRAVDVEGLDKPVHETTGEVEIKNVDPGSVRFAEGVSSEVLVKLRFDDVTVERSFAVRVRFSHDPSQDPVLITVPSAGEKVVYKTVFKGTKRGLEQLEAKINGGEFYFVCPIQIEPDRPTFTKGLENFTWPDGALPKGVSLYKVDPAQGTLVVSAERVTKP